MGYTFSFGFILPLLILSAVFQKVLCDDDEDEEEYEAWFADDVTDCKDFENKVLRSDLAMKLFQSEDDSSNMGLSGKLDVEQEMEDGTMLELIVSKIISMSEKELMWAISADFCSSMKDDGVPWKEVMEQINITECPVPVKTYPINNLTLNLDWMKGHMSRKFIGSYQLELRFLNKLKETISCHNFDVDIARVSK